MLKALSATPLAYFFLATLAMADTAPIADETLRVTALHAIFPGMQISMAPRKQIDESSSKKPGPYKLDSQDALAKENVYRVVGKPTNQAEQCAAEDLQVSGKFSDTRLLRFELFRSPHNSEFLTVLQYSFEGANPSGPCWSVGFLARLGDADGLLTVKGMVLTQWSSSIHVAFNRIARFNWRWC